MITVGKEEARKGVLLNSKNSKVLDTVMIFCSKVL